MTIDWEFNKVVDIIGWNDPGLTNFKDIDPLQAGAEEHTQNSIDNAADPEVPVEMVWELHFKAREEIPGIDTLENALKDCSRDLQQQPKNAQEEIKQAYHESKRAKLPILTIRDSGTTGMRNGSFFTFLRTQALSSDSGERGGSHGLGKSASWNLSRLRTIFVSSVWYDDSNKNLDNAVQGRTTLAARKVPEPSQDDAAKYYSNIGYWGVNYNPIKFHEHGYQWLNDRDANEIGTSIHIIGFKNPKRWQHQLITFALAKYFVAFYKGTLSIVVKDKNNEYLINKDKLKHYLSMELDNKELLENTRQYYELLADNSGQRIEKEFQVKRLGTCRLLLKVNENEEDRLCKKICILRKNMMITDKLKQFSKSFTHFKNFVGILQFESEEGNQLIRRMEPPQHNDINPQFLPDEERKNGKEALKDLSAKMLEIVQEFASYSTDTSERIDALCEFLQDEGDLGEDNIEIDPNGNWNLPTLKPIKRPKIQSKLEDTSDTEERGTAYHFESDKPRPKGTNPGPGPDDGNYDGVVDGGSGTTSINESLSLVITKKRIIKLSNRRLKIVVGFETNSPASELEIFEQNSEGLKQKVEVISSDLGECSSGSVILQTGENKYFDFHVELKSPIAGSMHLNIKSNNQQKAAKQ